MHRKLVKTIDKKTWQCYIISANKTCQKRRVKRMDKEEILARSKKENVYGDEREKAVRTKRDAFGGWGFTILGIVIMFIKIFHGDPAADILSILFCTSGLSFTYEGIKLRKKVTVVCGIVLLLCAVYFFYRFCMGISE